MAADFRGHPMFAPGFNSPTRFEADVYDCEVWDEIWWGGHSPHRSIPTFLRRLAQERAVFVSVLPKEVRVDQQHDVAENRPGRQ